MLAVGKGQSLFCLINFIFVLFHFIPIIIDIIVTDSIVTRPDVIGPFHLYCIVKMCGQMLLRLILFVIWFMFLLNHVGTRVSPALML